MTNQQQPIIWTKTELRRTIQKRFHYNDILTLCYDSGIDPDSWGNIDKQTLTRNLVIHSDHNNRLPTLLQLCREQRPHVSWPDQIIVTETEDAHDESFEDNKGPFGLLPKHLITFFIGVALAAFLAIFLFGVTRAVFNFSQIPTRVSLVPTLPPTVATPLLPTVTLTPPEATFELPDYNLYATEIYTDSTGAFSLVKPKEWPLFSFENRPDPLARAIFQPKDFPSIYWRLLVQVSPSPFDHKPSLEELERFVLEYVGNAFSEFPNRKIEKSKASAEQMVIETTCSFTFPGPDTTVIPMKAIAEVRLHDDVMTVFIIYLPRDQFEERAIQTLRDSIIITSEFKER